MINYSSKKSEKYYLLFTLFKITILILLGAVMVYGFNNPFTRLIYYGSIILIFFFSKDKVFPIALIFILIANPSGLFYTSPYNWILGITSKVGLLYSHAFAIAIFAKYLINISWRGHLLRGYINKEYKYFILYVGFLLIWGLIFGHSSKSAYDLVTTILVFSMFYVLSKVFSLNEFTFFNRIIFGFCIIYSVVSVLDILFVGQVSKLLFFGQLARGPAVTEDLVRIFGGVWIALYSLIFSLYYILNNKRLFNYYFLFIVIISSQIILINSGTRGWITASLLLLSSFLLFYILKRKILVIHSISALIIVLLGLLILPLNLKENIKGSFERFSTVRYVAEGDLTAGGTASRWNVRGPKVLSKFSESPIFGYGFSKETSNSFDPHVGNHTILLVGGILGISILLITILKLVIFLFLLEKSNKEFMGLFIFGLGLLSIVIIHSTNMIAISFVRMPVNSAFVIALIFNFINANINQYKSITVE